MIDTSNEDRLMTAKEAARYLGYAEGTVRNKASSGDLPIVKLATGALRFRKSELDAWLKATSVSVPVADPGSAA